MVVFKTGFNPAEHEIKLSLNAIYLNAWFVKLRKGVGLSDKHSYLYIIHSSYIHPREQDNNSPQYYSLRWHDGIILIGDINQSHIQSRVLNVRSTKIICSSAADKKLTKC